MVRALIVAIVVMARLLAVGGRVISSVKGRTENIHAAHLQNLWGRVRLIEAEKIAQVAHFETPAGIEGYGIVPV